MSVTPVGMADELVPFDNVTVFACAAPVEKARRAAMDPTRMRVDFFCDGVFTDGVRRVGWVERRLGFISEWERVFVWCLGI